MRGELMTTRSKKVVATEPPVITQTDRPILTKEEVAEILRVSPGTIAGLTRSRARRILPHIKIGKFLRFRKVDVEKYISEAS
jgi:excisionase family DNA binding protein